MKVSREFLTTIINYKHAASKDETRPYLNTIAIRRIDKQIELTAASGYIAIKSLWSFEGDIKFTNNVYYLLPTEDIKKIDTYLKSNKIINIFSFDTDDTFIKISINDNYDADNTINIRIMNRDYPIIDTLYPAPNKLNSIDAISFNPDFITDVRKAVFGTRKMRNTPRFDIKFTSSLGPITVTCKHEGNEHRALVAPLK